MTPPRPPASGDLEHASATHRTVLLHAIAIGARPERVEAIVEALIVAVRAEALATRQSEIDELVADFQRLHAKYKVKAAPLPRAVRELLRDVVLLDRERQATLTPFSEFVPMSVSQRAARILGTTPAAIVARARKVRK